MRGVPWRLLAAGCLTALLLDLPFPIAGPLPLWRTIFAWFALAPLLAALLRMDFSRRRRWALGWSFASGWLTGALWFGANCYWVYDTMHLYGGMDKPMAVVCLLAFSLYLGFWFGVFALALALIRRATVGGKFAWVSVAAIPFLWVAMEFALARIPEFPWDLLGYSQVDNALLMRLAPWTGVYGVSFVVAAANALSTALFVVNTAKRGLFASGQSVSKIACVISLSIGFAASSHFKIGPESPNPTATAVLVQPNLDVDKDDVWVGPEWDRQIAQFGALGGHTCGSYLAGLPQTEAAAVVPNCPPSLEEPSLVIWPESPAPFRDADPRFQSAMASVAQADKAPMIVGAIGMDADPGGQKYQIYNSAVVVAQDGHFVGRYDKIHLVPFGEYVPFRRVLFFIRQVAQSSGDTSIGAERKVFRLAPPAGTGDSQARRYGVFICYESVFGDEVRQFAQLGAEVFVNISDDGWYGDTSAPWQHLNMARMRAIENRRWILRDTNNGVTAAIDPYGTVRQSIARHEVGALAARYGFNSELTFYTVHGDWVGWICAILALVLVLGSGRKILWESAAKPE